MIIDNFSGGLVTGVDSIYLNKTQSSVLLDANVERLGLQSDKQPVFQQEAFRSFYQFPILDSEPEQFHITSSSRKRSYAEFAGALCFSDGGPECKTTSGAIDAATGEFVWDALGVSATDGDIVATAITIDDIVGASITLNVGSTVGDGYLIAETVRYRIVDANDTVYIASLEDNTGYSTATIVLPDTTYKVYREIIDSYGNYTDKYLLVGQGSITDGSTQIDDNYTFTKEVEIPDFAGHRLSLLDGLAYTSPYTVANDNTATLVIDSLHSIDGSKVWQSYDINIQLTKLDADSETTGIASTFIYDSELYIMAKLTGLFHIYKYDAGIITEIINVEQDIDDEYFKGTTIESGAKTYFFNPRDGKVALFDGTTFEITDFEIFPDAKAEDTIFTLKEGSTDVYAIINGRHEANIRKISLPSLAVSLVDTERTRVEIIRGLGGTSGSYFTDGDFQVFPVHDAMIRFSTATNQLIQEIGIGSTIPTLTKYKGFVIDTRTATLALSVYTDLLASNANLGIWDNDLGNVPTWFDIRTLTGTYIYNVSQRTPDGLDDGPIMFTHSDPVSIDKGHISVDLSGITHTYDLRLYRTGGYLTYFTMVEDVDPTNTYIDKRDDVTIALGKPGALAYVDAPPEGLMYLTEHRGMLFGSVGNVLYWSQAGQQNAWDMLNNYVIVDRVVTGLGSCTNGLVIFMNGRSKLLTGWNRTEFRLRTISNSKGTIDSYSIQSVDNGVLFFGDTGLCFTDGSLVQELSYIPLGYQDFDVIDSVATSRSYYALLKGYTNSSLKEARVIFRFDYGGTQIFTLLSGDGIEGLGMLFDELAHVKNGSLFKTLEGPDRIFNYKSAALTEGAPTEIKEFDKVRISGRFIGILKVFIDDVTVINEDITISNNSLVNFHIPKNKNKGKALMFELVGTGFISSIEYTLTGRKTTK